MNADWLQARESRFCIDGPAGAIELLVNGVGDHPRAIALICHPHPLHGGSMDNKVVFTLARACRDQDIIAVRFNFRGVGASAGVHDNGVGEAVDAHFLFDELRKQSRGLPVVLAGFSFGAAIVAQLTETVDAAALVLAAPPVTRYGMDRISAVPVPVLLLQGDDDAVVDSAHVYEWFSYLSSPKKVRHNWQNGGHFFHGMLPEIKSATEAFLSALVLPSVQL
ncbi:MAG TPA: alpha/beta hydrolase [Pseudomonadales bacterium]|nr:alpha/beta hydrolase [Pseudomonadales bacterium]